MSSNLYTFRPVQRLLQAAQFKQVFDHARFKVHQPVLMVLAISASSPRLGLIVAKKKLRRAHERNRFKRLVRESFRLNQHQLPPLDMVFMAKPDALTTSNSELARQLAEAWRLLKQKHVKSTDNSAQSGNKRTDHVEKSVSGLS